MPSFRRLSVLALVLVAAGAWAQTKKKKAPKVKPPPEAVTQVEVKLVLDEAQEKVGACVLEGADDGPLNQVLHVKVHLNGVGQVLAADVALTPENAQAAKTRACITDVVKALTYPKTGAPLVVVEREWTFKTE